MIALGVAATWIAISLAGAKALVLFARAAAASEFEADLYPVGAGSGFGCEDADWSEAGASASGTRR